MTADTALRLARYFGTTPHFWLNLQTAHDLSRAELAVGPCDRAGHTSARGGYRVSAAFSGVKDPDLYFFQNVEEA